MNLPESAGKVAGITVPDSGGGLHDRVALLFEQKGGLVHAALAQVAENRLAVMGFKDLFQFELIDEKPPGQLGHGMGPVEVFPQIAGDALHGFDILRAKGDMAGRGGLEFRTFEDAGGCFRYFGLLQKAAGHGVGGRSLQFPQCPAARRAADALDKQGGVAGGALQAFQFGRPCSRRLPAARFHANPERAAGRGHGHGGKRPVVAEQRPVSGRYRASAEFGDLPAGAALKEKQDEQSVGMVRGGVARGLGCGP